MKNALYALVILIATCALASAQTGVTGTWRVTEPGTPIPWELVLKTNGTSLTGKVNSCNSVQGTIEIFEGKIDGNTITFKCQSGDGRRTVSLTGRINGDEMAFTWEKRDTGDGTRGTTGLFAPTAPHQFTATRVRAGDLAKGPDDVHGRVFAAAVNLVPREVRATASLFLPPHISRVRLVLVVIDHALGGEVLNEPEWSRLSETLDAALLGAQFDSISRGDVKGLGATDDDGRAEALVSLLQRLAQDSGHEELVGAPLLFWGHSLGGSAAAGFAARFPDRTLAFVRYHTSPILGAGLNEVSQIPALLLSGGKEAVLNAPGTEALWKQGRAVGAPWTFAIEPDAKHGNPEDLKKANDLIIPWITAVLRQRLSADGKILPVTDGSALLGNNQTGVVAPYSNFSGSKAAASWLPDEATARAWQVVVGVGAAK